MKVLSALLVLALLPLTGCGGEEAAPAQEVKFTATTNPAPPGASESQAAGEWDERIKVKTPDDASRVEFKRRGTDVKIEWAGASGTGEIRGDLKDSGKRKYSDAAGQLIAEVKPSDNGFKVRTADGKLLWKVKIDSDKIKVSDNEENQNPWVLKTKYEDKVKILDPAERELAEVKFYRDRQKVKIKDMLDKELWEVNTNKYSPAYGVMLFDRVPENLRYVIMAELLQRG